MIPGSVQRAGVEDRRTAGVSRASWCAHLEEHVDERIVIGGTAHLARYGEAFPLAIQPVLEALLV